MQIHGRQIKPGSITNAEIASGAAIALSKLAEAVIQADGGQAFTGNQSMGGNLLTGVADPVSAQDAATKSYVDAVATGLDIKSSVRVATTAPLTLATAFENGDIVDGVTLVTGNRVLVKDQTAGSENGIYIVQATGAPVRAPDADTSTEVTAGMFTFVEEGIDLRDTGWVLATDNPITLDTTALTFTQFSSAGVIQAGAGMVQVGLDFNVVAADNSLTVNANNMQVKLDAAGAITVAASGIGANTDGTTLEIATNALQIKDGGVSTIKIANDAVDKTKIAADVAGKGLAQAVGGELDVVEVEEVPAGLVDGSNATFTLSATPANGKVNWYINGLRQKVTVDYTIAGAVITTLAATHQKPQTGDDVYAMYVA